VYVVQYQVAVTEAVFGAWIILRVRPSTYDFETAYNMLLQVKTVNHSPHLSRRDSSQFTGNAPSESITYYLFLLIQW